MEYSFSQKAYTAFLWWGILSALGTSVSTFVDAVLIGNFVGSAGLAAGSIATPIFLIYGLFGVTLAAGGSVLIGRALGANEKGRAQELFRRLLGLAALLSAACMALGLLLCAPILHFLGAADGELFALASAYAVTVFACAPLFIFYHVLSFTVRGDGDPRRAALASVVLIALNIALDWYFMKDLGLGIGGASLALCIATFCAVLILLTHFMQKDAQLRLSLALPGARETTAFVKNGFGTGSALLFQAAVMSLFNRLLVAGSQGTLNVAFFNILYTMSTFAAASFEGAASALTPVAAIFSGEKDAESVMDVFHMALKTVIIAGLCVMGLYIAFAGPIVRFFGLSGAAAAAAARAFRLFALSLPFTGVNVLLTAFWQSVSRWKLAGGMSVLRNLLLLSAFGALLIPLMQAPGLSVSYAACEALCSLLALLVMCCSGFRRKLEADCAGVNRSFERTYPMREESIAQIAEDFERVSETWEIGMKTAFFLNLMVEELMLNIIKFGLEQDGQSCYLAVKLLENGDEYILRIRDNVSSYNPFESEGDEIDNAVLTMIRRKAKYYDYQRKLIFNYLYLII